MVLYEFSTTADYRVQEERFVYLHDTDLYFTP